MRALDSGRQRRQDRKCAPRRQAGARVGTVSALALPSPSRRLSGSNPHPVETGRVSEASGDTVGDVSRTLTWGLTFLTSCVLTATGPGSGSLKSPSPNPSRKPLSSFPSCPRLGLAIAQASQRLARVRRALQTEADSRGDCAAENTDRSGFAMGPGTARYLF